MKLYGLIGFPLSHSFSCQYFKEKFKKEKLTSYQYQNFEIPYITALPEIIKNNHNLFGLNVTIPYKIAVLPYLNSLSEEAKIIGAVNTIKINRHQNTYFLEGFNTDAFAFITTLKPLLNSQHKKALILGTGGAAKAAAFGLTYLNIEYKFVSRTPQKNNSIGYIQVAEYIENGYNIIINATPIGMFPNINEAPPLPYHLLSNNFLIYDMIYNPQNTLLMQLAAQQGAKTHNGEQMLITQAELSWEIWQE